MRALFLGLAVATCIVGLALAEGSQVSLRHPRYTEQVEAARLMRACLEAVRRERLSLGIPIDPQLDPNRTGLIGEEFTEMTTSVGNLDAKRTSTNPAFAALMVRYFHAAGLKAGDVVAVGASGSFPGLILATLAAARVLDLKPVVIYSVGASMYGANIPRFTFIEMLSCLNREGLIPFGIAAVSPGGDGDVGKGVLFEGGEEGGDGEETGDGEGAPRDGEGGPGPGGPLLVIARRSGLPLIYEATLADSIRARLRIYEEHSGGRPIACFVNVGGAAPNFGTTMASLEFPNGLVTRAHISSADRERGLVFEFAARGIPVIHLLSVRDLAMKNGIPVDPVPFPPIGEGRVYCVSGYRRGVLLATLAVCLGLLSVGVL